MRAAAEDSPDPEPGCRSGSRAPGGRRGRESGASRPGSRRCVAELPVARGGGEAAGRARVRGEDAGHLAEGDGMEAEVQVEGSGAPHVAPQGGEGLRASAVLCGEAGDDVAEDGVRKAADVVRALPFLFCWLPPLPVGSGDHPHGRSGMAARRRPPAGGGGLWTFGNWNWHFSLFFLLFF